MNYGSKGDSDSNILTPIYEVYYGLINNNVIDINKLSKPDAGDTEKAVYKKYTNALEDVFKKIDNFLSTANTITNKNAGDMEDYLDYFYDVLKAD